MHLSQSNRIDSVCQSQVHRLSSYLTYHLKIFKIKYCDPSWNLNASLGYFAFTVSGICKTD